MWSPKNGIDFENWHPVHTLSPSWCSNIVLDAAAKTMLHGRRRESRNCGPTTSASNDFQQSAKRNHTPLDISHTGPKPPDGYSHHTNPASWKAAAASSQTWPAPPSSMPTRLASRKYRRQRQSSPSEMKRHGYTHIYTQCWYYPSMRSSFPLWSTIQSLRSLAPFCLLQCCKLHT